MTSVEDVKYIRQCFSTLVELCSRNLSHEDKVWSIFSMCLFYGLYGKMCSENISRKGTL